MKQAIAFVLLGIYMLSFSEVHQLFKFPVLLEHFSEHQRMNEGITLFAFLEMHYSGIFEKDADYQRDQELPFRTSECMMNNVPVCECSFAPFKIQFQVLKPERQFILANEDNISLADPQDIFQPPRPEFASNS